MNAVASAREIPKICSDPSSNETPIDLAWAWASESAAVESRQTEARFRREISPVQDVCLRLTFQNQGQRWESIEWRSLGSPRPDGVAKSPTDFSNAKSFQFAWNNISGYR